MYIAYNIGHIYMEVNMFFESKNTHSERQSLKHSVQQSIQRSIQHSEQRSLQHGPQHRVQHRLLLKKATLIFALALTVSSVTEYATEFNAPVEQAAVTEKNIKKTATAKKSLQRYQMLPPVHIRSLMAINLNSPGKKRRIKRHLKYIQDLISLEGAELHMQMYAKR